VAGEVESPLVVLHPWVEATERAHEGRTADNVAKDALARGDVESGARLLA
jgi:hypothetical protein